MMGIERQINTLTIACTDWYAHAVENSTASLWTVELLLVLRGLFGCFGSAGLWGLRISPGLGLGVLDQVNYC